LRVGSRGAGANWLGFLHLRADQTCAGFSRTRGSPAFTELLSGWESRNHPGAGDVGDVLYPQVAAGQNQQRVFRATIKWTLIVMMIVALFYPLALFSPALVRLLYGDQFLDAVPLLRYTCPAWCFSPDSINKQSPWRSGLPVMYVVALALAGRHIGLNLILLPRIGGSRRLYFELISYGSGFCSSAAILSAGPNEVTREALRTRMSCLRASS